MSYSLILRDPIKHGTKTLLDGSLRILDWRRSIKRIGGFWSGSGRLFGSEVELSYLFYSGLFGDLLEKDGGLVTWNGYVADMTLKRGIYTQRRSTLDMANSIRVVYTSIGDNLLTNGGAGDGYFDAGVFQRAPLRAETNWSENAFSIASYGRIEEILLEAAMTTEQANARAVANLA